MKHLDGEPCFVELSRIECIEIVNDLELAKKYCIENDLRTPLKSVNEYIKKFRSFYNPITIKEELERR